MLNAHRHMSCVKRHQTLVEYIEDVRASCNVLRSGICCELIYFHLRLQNFRYCLGLDLFINLKDVKFLMREDM